MSSSGARLSLYRIVSDDGETFISAAETSGEAIDLHDTWMEPETTSQDWDIRRLDPAELVRVHMESSSLFFRGVRNDPPSFWEVEEGLFEASAAAWAELAGAPTQVSSTCF